MTYEQDYMPCKTSRQEPKHESRKYRRASNGTNKTHPCDSDPNESVVPFAADVPLLLKH